MTTDSPIHPVPSGLKAFTLSAYTGDVLFLKYRDPVTNRAGFWLAGQHYRFSPPLNFKGQYLANMTAVLDQKRR